MTSPAPSWEDTCANCGGYIDSMNGEAVSGLRYGVALTWCGDECLAEWADKRKLEKPGPDFKHEVECPACGATIRARMADGPSSSPA